MKSEKAKEFIDGCINNITAELADHAKWLRHGRGIRFDLIKSPIIKRELNRSMNYYILYRVAELKQKRK